MAKIIVSADNFSIVAKYSLEELKKVKTCKPNALVLYEGTGEDKEQIFAVSAATNGNYNRFGISFASETITDHKACFTAKVPADVENVKDFIIESAGMGVVHLAKIEEQIAEALVQIEQERETIAGCIEGL